MSSRPQQTDGRLHCRTYRPCRSPHGPCRRDYLRWKGRRRIQDRCDGGRRHSRFSVPSTPWKDTDRGAEGMSVSTTTNGSQHTRSGEKMMSIAYDYARESTLEVWLSKPKLLLIDGQHRASATGRTFKTLDPATGQVIATVAEGNEVDVDRAVAAARRAFEGPWRTMRAAERGKILHRLVELMKVHADEIAALESLDAGKPISGVLRQDLPAAIDTLSYYAGWADKISGEVVSTRDDALTYTIREPVGVVAAIVPWNFPLMIGMWKIAPALACGCTIVMKPAALTSLSALRLGELALEAGLPPGALNIVTGPGRVVGDALDNHPDVGKVTFTGSPGVDAEFCAARRVTSNACRSNSAASPPTSSLTTPTSRLRPRPLRPESSSTPGKYARRGRAFSRTRRFTTGWSTG